MQPCNRWPVLVIVVIAGFLALTAWSFRQAASGASAVTDPDYYSHGLHYGETVLERQTATTLGWDTAPRLRGRQVTIQLRDRGQQLVTGAYGSLAILTPGHPSTQGLALRETEPGSYQVELPIDIRGEQPVEVTFHRDGARLSKRLLLAIP